MVVSVGRMCTDDLRSSVRTSPTKLRPTDDVERGHERDVDRPDGPNGIAALLRPESIVVIGVSERVASVGHQIVEHLVAGGFRGPVFAVGRHAEFVAGLPVVPTISDIACPVDLAVIAVGAEEMLEVARQCVDAEVRGIVVVSAGFAEVGAGGRARQDQLRDLVREAGIRLIGPNCLGVVTPSPDVSMHAVFADMDVRPGSIALMSQSGAVGLSVAAMAFREGLGLSAFVSVGNKADVSGNDLLEYWEHDDQTKVIAFYLESFGNPRRFSVVAQRVSATKPIVVLKAGRTMAGSKAAGSHTAALALPDAMVDALLAQSGVSRVDDLRSLLNVAHAFDVLRLPKGRRIAVIGNAGGIGILVADALAQRGCALAELGPATSLAIDEAAPTNSTRTNPVDLTAAVDSVAFGRCIEAALADPGVDGIIAIHATLGAETRRAAQRCIAEIARGADKPIVAVMATADPPDVDASLVIVEMPEEAAEVVAKLAERSEWLARRGLPLRPIPTETLNEVRELLGVPSGRTGEGWLDPVRAFAIAQAIGIAVAAPVYAVDDDAAAAAASRLGVPVSLKAANPALVHRSDRNAIRLGLHDEFSVASAFDAIHLQLGEEMGGAIVQPMCEPGVEMIVGITNDPLFGPLLLVGAGGHSAELWKDTSVHLAPLPPGEARRMIERLRSAPLLHGFRGAPLLDIDAVVDALERLAQIAVEVPEIAELDVNPLIVHEHGAVAVDVKVRVIIPTKSGQEAHEDRTKVPIG